MTTTAVANQKGGVGKTAITINVGGALAEFGRRVLLVVLEPNGFLPSCLKLDVSGVVRPLAAALSADGRQSARGPDVVTHSTTDAGGRLDVLPHTAEMLMVVRELDKTR